MVAETHTPDDILKKYDLVLVNLDIIARIIVSDKLYVDNSKLVLQPYSSTRSITRWWNNYNRADCIKFIKELYEDISSLIILLISISTRTDVTVKKRQHKKIKKKYKRQKAQLIAACRNTKQGLLHLMITYKDDSGVGDSINKILAIVNKMD